MLKVKRYLNRKFYLSGGKNYLTLKDIAELVKQGNELEVIDNETKENITNEVLHKVLPYVKLDNEKLYSLIRQ